MQLYYTDLHISSFRQRCFYSDPVKHPGMKSMKLFAIITEGAVIQLILIQDLRFLMSLPNTNTLVPIHGDGDDQSDWSNIQTNLDCFHRFKIPQNGILLTHQLTTWADPISYLLIISFLHLVQTFGSKYIIHIKIQLSFFAPSKMAKKFYIVGPRVVSGL